MINHIVYATAIAVAAICALAPRIAVDRFLSQLRPVEYALWRELGGEKSDLSDDGMSLWAVFKFAIGSDPVVRPP